MSSRPPRGFQGYTPAPVPETAIRDPVLQRYLDDELSRIAAAVNDVLNHVPDPPAPPVPETPHNVEVGSIMAWPADIGDVPTDGRWLHCNGQSVAVADHAELFAVIGYRYGGAGANFNVPNYAGEFLRGRDAGAGNDPDRAERTDRGDGTAGDAIGTKQAGQIQSHMHRIGLREFRSNRGPDRTEVHGWGGANTTAEASGETIGGNETRPRNVYVNWIIYRGRL